VEEQIKGWIQQPSSAQHTPVQGFIPRLFEKIDNKFKRIEALEGIVIEKV